MIFHMCKIFHVKYYSLFYDLDVWDLFNFRHVPKSKNLGEQVVMRRAAAARWRLLFCQNMGGQLPPPFIDAPVKTKYGCQNRSYFKIIHLHTYIHTPKYNYFVNTI